MKQKKTKIIRTVSLFVLFIAFLNIYAFSVRHVVTGGQQFGALTAPFKGFIEFPLLVGKVFEEATGLPPNHVLVDTSFTEINQLDRDVFTLNAHFEDNKYIHVLSNLRTDSILHSWTFTKDTYSGTDELYRVTHSPNPILLDDGSIIGMLYGTNNIFRLDKASNVVWHNTSKSFHHSLNLSHDNHVWVCTWSDAYTHAKHSNQIIEFEDDGLAKINIETGEIVYHRSLAEIFVSNDYVSLIHGYGNEGKSWATDPFHLNDIQPILFDGPFWKKGDVLLSLRHRSVIILYRPETDKIIQMISGPFLSQHDVDIISESEISIFNNNSTRTGKLAPRGKNVESDIKLTLESSNVIIYDFSDSTFRKPLLDVIQKEKIYTRTQGTHTFLSNGDLFIESTDSGRIYLMRNGKMILKKYANRANRYGTAEKPHWMSIYEEVNF